MPHVFISYAHEDRAFVDNLSTKLKAAKIDAWFDIRLKPGAPDWEYAIRKKIRTARAVLYIASPEARLSLFVRDELTIADMERVPVYDIWAKGEDERRMDCFPMGRGSAQYIDARGAAYDSAVTRIIEVLQDIGAEEDNQPDALIAVGSYITQMILDLATQATPKAAIKDGHLIANQIRKYLRGCAPAQSRELKRLLAYVLYAIAYAHHTYAPPSKVISLTKSFIVEMGRIAKELDDPEICAIAQLSLGTSYYVEGNYPKAIETIAVDTVLDNLRNPDMYIRAMRVLGSCYSLLTNESQFKAVAARARELIKQGIPDQGMACEAAVGLATGWALLGNLDNAFETLGEGQTTLKSIGGEIEAPFRAIQTLQEHVRILRLSGTKDTTLLENIGNKGLELAQDKYMRYADNIKAELDKGLN